MKLLRGWFDWIVERLVCDARGHDFPPGLLGRYMANEIAPVTVTCARCGVQRTYRWEVPAKMVPGSIVRRVFTQAHGRIPPGRLREHPERLVVL